MLSNWIALEMLVSSLSANQTGGVCGYVSCNEKAEMKYCKVFHFEVRGRKKVSMSTNQLAGDREILENCVMFLSQRWRRWGLKVKPTIQFNLLQVCFHYKEPSLLFTAQKRKISKRARRKGKRKHVTMHRDRQASRGISSSSLLSLHSTHFDVSVVLMDPAETNFWADDFRGSS